MTIESAFVETLKLISRLESELQEVKRNNSTLGIAVKKGRETTLASDSFTAEFTYHILTPESGNTDDLSTINGGLEGRVIAIRTGDAAYTITVKDGVGNIDLCGSDFDLDCEEKVMTLVFDSSLDAWIQFGVGGGGGAANFLSLTDTPSSYSGEGEKYVAVNSGETALEFITSAPGSVASTTRDIFDFLHSTKASADTPDDEFDGVSLDAKWTAVNGSAASVDIQQTGNVSQYELDTTNNVLLMQAGVNGSQRIDLRQDFTLGDGESIVVAFSPPLENVGGSSANNQLNVLLTLNDDDTDPLNGNYVFLGWDTQTSHSHVQMYNGGAIGDTIDEIPDASQTLFFRFNRVGLVYHGFWSGDGASWSYLGSDTAGSAYDNLWIHVDNGVSYSEPASIVTWHWVRQGTNDLFPWSPLVTIVTNVEGGGSRLNLGSLADLTISGGAITLPSSGSFFNVLAETGTTDDLTDIGGTFSDGDVIVLRPDSGDTITVLETGNLSLSGTFSMDAEDDKLTLIYDGAISKWCEITSSGNA